MSAYGSIRLSSWKGLLTGQRSQCMSRIRSGLSATQTQREMSSSRDPLARAAPPPLPRAQQREFEELLKTAQAPLSQGLNHSRESAEAELALHPDAPTPLKPDFEGEVNPATGEKGGPKREPVGKWGEGEGDWSFKGRVSDF